MQEEAKNSCNAFDKKDSSMEKADFTPLPDSSHYIHKLESRLLKIKGINKDLTSKEMIKVIQAAREDLMSRLISSSSNQSVYSDDKEVSVTYIEKKLFPEKIGVTYEEIQHLLECDVLEKNFIRKSSDSSNDSSVDR